MFKLNLPKNINKINTFFKRTKHKANHWSVLRKKTHPVDKALDHFNEFYSQVFAQKWPEIRAGLLGKQKYVAVVNNYSDPKKICEKLEQDGALNIRKLFELEKSYIEERYTQSKRLRNLLRIWEMDRQTEAKFIENDEDLTRDKNRSYDTLSVEKSMENAKLEVNRMVDGSRSNSLEILQEFIPATEIKGREDFVPESKYYEYYDETCQLSVKIEREFDLHFPENLNIYSHEVENDTPFKPPGKGTTGVYDYYLMDGGSVFPILALDIKPNNTFLDMCGAPGGKSLLAFQTLYPSTITSNDISKSRVDRIYNVYKQFLFDFEEKFLKTGKITLHQMDGRYMSIGSYDRILVDVPCTTDRHSLKENDNNIFNSSRIRERLKLPELQSELLFNACKMVNEDGCVVYSTCSLSPIQNDGVVHMTLKRIWEETQLQFVVKDLSPALLQGRCLYKLASPKLMKYGHLVLPCKAQNFGPTYFCKLKRVK